MLFSLEKKVEFFRGKTRCFLLGLVLLVTIATRWTYKNHTRYIYSAASYKQIQSLPKTISLTTPHFASSLICFDFNFIRPAKISYCFILEKLHFFF